ncbi:MAG TPA: 4Fe-4S binding protein, partial [Candidatus Dorea gallistercoris]|nr:4Fe-4S binding protein [Candidatus Dorea gallistercoris]
MRVIDFKDASCRHCYKCVRNCEVKAISVQNEQAHIMKDHCINCGHCLEVCPQNAKTFASDMERVKGYLGRGDKVIISIAPSYLGVLDYQTPGQVVAALEKLGFAGVRETAEGAALVTREYGKLLREGKMENIITTCCPSVNDLIEKYYPSLTRWMAPVVSPMIAHGRLIRDVYGEDVKVVFLGPCIAKKEEAIGDERVRGAIDAIL